MLTYQIAMKPDDNGTFLVTAPAFSEVTTFGGDREDCIVHAIDAIEEAIAARIARGADVPQTADPSALRRGDTLVRLPFLTSLRLRLRPKGKASRAM